MKRKDGFGKGPVEFPSTSARFTERSIPIRTRKRYYGTTMKMITAGVILAVVLGISLTTFQVVRFTQLSEELDQQVQRTYNPSFRVKYDELGASIIQNWYMQREPVVNYASNVTWPGQPLDEDGQVNPQLSDPEEEPREVLPEIRGITFVSGEQNAAQFGDRIENEYPEFTNPYEEILTYYMVYNNQPVHVSINVVLPDVDDDSSSPVLVSSPTLTPASSSDSMNVTSNPEGAGMERAEIEEPGMESLENWAASWAENDGSALKQAAQDDSSGVYSGLGNWQYISGTLTPNWSYETTLPNDEGLFHIAEVSFDIQQEIIPPDQVDAEEPESQTYTTTQVMNVLIANPNSELPRIVSWGPAGTWSDLAPFSVAEDPETSRGGQTGNQGEEDPNEPGVEPTEDATGEPTGEPVDPEATDPAEDEEGGEE